MVSFKDVRSSLVAFGQNLGDPQNRLNISWASGEPPNHEVIKTVPKKSIVGDETLKNTIISITAKEHEDFEKMILEKMRQKNG